MPNKVNNCVGTPWPAVDGLGRVLPMSDETGPPKAGHFVGIFYFITFGREAAWFAPYADLPNGPFDISKILQADPDALSKPDSPLWGPEGSSHYWGESAFGYYQTVDPWVIRRHAYLLADAGVDTLIFDTTNRLTFRDYYLKICEVFTQVRQEGGKTPQIIFMTNTKAEETAQELYRDLYQPGLYADLWFRWQDKPLLISDPAQAGPEIKKFFTLRRAHWPMEMVNTECAWYWEATYPQPYGFTDDPNVPEQVNVSVAQNLRAVDGIATHMSTGDARGRSFHEGQQNIKPGSVNQGYNMQEQWRRAFELDPPFVMVTGWNEWTAGRENRPARSEPITFCDQYNQEFSRDIEPVKGMHQDNYYYQLIAGVRKYKGTPPLPKASAPKSIDIDEPFAQWQDVGPDYPDHVGETLPRDFPGVHRLHYRNTTGRNEFISLKVARDAENVYFYARTLKPITPCADKDWMMLLIDTTGNHASGKGKFDFIVNRQVVNPTMTVIERNVGEGKWKKAAEIPMRVQGNEMHLAISRTMLGFLAGDKTLTFDFKWADNLQWPGEVTDLYVKGDVAPQGRFNYRYIAI